MKNTHDPRLGKMGIPLACGGPLCGVDHHHPLCKLYAPGAVSTAPAAPVSAEPTDDEIIDIAVEPLGIDCDRMPYGVVVFARALLSRYSSAPVAAHAQQPVSGAAGLQADGALVADERELVALAVKHHIRFPRNRDLIAFIDEARASLAIAQPATQPQPSGNSGELPATQTQGMTLGQRIAHVGGRENAQGYVEFGSPMAVHALIQQVLRDFHRQGRVSLAPAQQDADKVDAERYRAYRAAIVAEDGAFLGRAESYLSSLGLRAEVLPTEDQIDAAMDAARKEVQP